MSNENRHRLPQLSRPTMAPFASLFLVVSCFFLLTCTLKGPVKGLIKLEETPRLPCRACSNTPDHTQIYVCLTASGDLSFSTSAPALQRAVLAQLAKKHGAPLAVAGLASLKPLAFVANRPDRLPTMLAAPTAPADQEAASSSSLADTQLLDCVEAARICSPELTNQPAGIYLSISAQTKASLVMRLLKLFQQRKLNRLFLLTHC